MKYIRTKDGRIIADGEGELIGYKLGTFEVHNKAGIVASYEPIEVLKIADTIEELCDEFVVGFNGKMIISALPFERSLDYGGDTLFGAIWTDKGLIYVAKMDNKGELELI